MARGEDLLFKPATWSVIATAVNGIATATKLAITGQQHFITAVSISCSGIPVTSVQVLIKEGSNVLDQWELPPAQFAPITPNFIRPYVGSPSSDVSITVGAMGAGIRGTVCIRGFTAMAG